MNNVVTTKDFSFLFLSSSSSSLSSLHLFSSAAVGDGVPKAPTAFTAKSWKKLHQHERQLLLIEWLKERGCPPDQIQSLLIYSSNEKIQAFRRKKLASYFPEYDNNTYFLELTPHKMRMHRQAIRRKEKRKNVNPSINKCMEQEGNIGHTLSINIFHDPSQNCLEPQIITPATASLNSKEDENECNHEEDPPIMIPISPETTTKLPRHDIIQELITANEQITPSRYRHYCFSSNYNDSTSDHFQNVTSVMVISSEQIKAY